MWTSTVHMRGLLVIRMFTCMNISYSIATVTMVTLKYKQITDSSINKRKSVFKCFFYLMYIFSYATPFNDLKNVWQTATYNSSRQISRLMDCFYSVYIILLYCYHACSTGVQFLRIVSLRIFQNTLLGTVSCTLGWLSDRNGQWHTESINQCSLILVLIVNISQEVW